MDFFRVVGITSALVGIASLLIGIIGLTLGWLKPPCPKCGKRRSIKQFDLQTEWETNVGGMIQTDPMSTRTTWRLCVCGHCFDRMSRLEPGSGRYPDLLGDLDRKNPKTVE